MGIKRPLTQQEVFESLVKEWLEPEKDKTKTIYSDETLHFSRLVKSFLSTIDYQADQQAVFDAIKLALKEMYGTELQINKVIKSKQE